MQAWNETIAYLAGICRPTIECGIAVLLRTTLPLTVALATGWLLRKCDPRSRAGIYTMGLTGSLALVVLSLSPIWPVKSYWMLALPGAAQSSARIVHSSRSHGLLVNPPMAVVERTPESGFTPYPAPQSGVRSQKLAEYPVSVPGAAESVPGFRPSGAGYLYAALCLLWACGALVSIMWLCVCHFRLRLLCRRAVPSSDPRLLAHLQELCRELRAPCPGVLVSAEIASPFVTGLLHPFVVVPADMLHSQDDATIRAVLAHEMHHIVAHDITWTLAGRIECALLWPQPLVWAVVRGWREATEDACDRAALDQKCSARKYARYLVTMAEGFTPHAPQRAAGLGMAAAQSMLARRVERILGGRARNPRKMSPTAVIGAACLFGLVLLFACRIVGAQSPEPPAHPGAPLPAPTAAARQAAEPPLAQETAQTNKEQQDSYRRELEAARRELAQVRAESQRSNDERRRSELEAAELRNRIVALERRNQDSAGVRKLLAEQQAVEAAVKAQRDADRKRSRAEQAEKIAAELQDDRVHALILLRKELAERELALLKAQQIYMPNHPQFRAAQAAADSTRQRLKALQQQMEDDIRQHDGVQRQFEEEMRQNQASNSATQQRQAEDLALVAKARAELAARAKIGKQKTDMERELSSLRAERNQKGAEADALRAEIARLRALLERIQKPESQLGTGK
jgi:beta-lactamase regulating signal transducer with metallopeptidase domain